MHLTIKDLEFIQNILPNCNEDTLRGVADEGGILFGLRQVVLKKAGSSRPVSCDLPQNPALLLRWLSTVPALEIPVEVGASFWVAWASMLFRVGSLEIARAA